MGSSDYTPFTQNVFPEFYVAGFTYCTYVEQPTVFFTKKENFRAH